MAYLLSDMSAGSDAMRKMEQNIIGAKYDEQIAADTALKSRLSNEEAQTRIKHEQLQTAVEEAKLIKHREAQSAIEKLQKSPGWYQKPYEQQAEEMAVAITPFDPQAASHLMTAAGTASLKNAQAALAKSNEAARRLNIFNARLSAVEDKDVSKFFDELPQEIKQSLEKDVPGISNVRDPKQLRAMMEAASQTTSGQTAAQNAAARRELERQGAEHKKELERLKEQLRSGRRSGKDSPTTKEEEKAANDITNRLIRIDHDYQKPLKDAQNKVDSAYLAYRSTILFDAKEKEVYEKAYAEHTDLQREKVDKQLNILEAYPESEAKTKLHKVLINIRDSIPVNAPYPKEKDKSTKTKPAPAEVPTSTSQADFDSKWAKLDSGKQLTAPDGTVYTKK